MASRSSYWRATPLGIFLLSIFFLATQTVAASAALGVDFGTQYIKAALVKPGTPIDIVLTKDSRRKELASIAFKPPASAPQSEHYPERAYGSDAAALAARFPADVYPNLKMLLGAVMEDAVVQEYAARHPALQLQPVEGRQTAAFKSGAFAADVEPWSVEELLAMQLQSIQKNAKAMAGSDSTVRSLVITVPPFYTAEEKRAVQMAAELAGLRVLSLITDGLAVGVQYATSRQFPNINEGGKPEHHLVFDMGAGSTKATVMRFQSRTVKDVGRFNKTVQEISVLGSAWDRTLGGDAFNALIVDDMLAQFVDSKAAKAGAVTAEAIKGHGRAIAKLAKEAERLRQILSANAHSQGSFEGLYEDVDFKYKITRAEFEQMTEAHAARVAEVVSSALKAAQLEVGDLSSVILHGGASRTPFVQKALESAIRSADKIRTNVNSDEAAVMGAGFRAAELSPGFRVKEIRTSEGTGYASGLRLAGPSGKEQHQRLWTATSPIGGATKELSFTNTEDFAITFYQTIDGSDRDIKTLATKNLTATVAELKEKHACPDGGVVVKVSVKLQDKDGEVVVVKAVAECEVEGESKEGFVDGVKNLFGFGKKDQVLLNDDEKPAEEGSEEASSSANSEQPSTSSSTSSSVSDSSSASSSAPSAEPSAKSKASKQIISIPIQHSVENSGVPPLSKEALQKTKSRLRAFDTSDRNRRLREEVLNQLEAFTYSVRDLLDNDKFVAASTDEERVQLEAKSSDAGEWIYGDGADASKDELKKRLDELKAIVAPIQKRMKEASDRPSLVRAVKDALGQSKLFISTMREQLKEYEAWQASSSASAAAAASEATESPSTAAMPSPSNDFEGLEDESPSAPETEAEAEAEREPQPDTASSTGSVEEMLKDHGPVPPLYSRSDLDEMERAHAETARWLSEQQAAQDALAPTADPVLLAKDLRDRKDKLEKLTLDLALRGMRNFESKAKQAAKDEKAKQQQGKGKGKGKKAKATEKKEKKDEEKRAEEEPKTEEVKGKEEEQKTQRERIEKDEL